MTHTWSGEVVDVFHIKGRGLVLGVSLWDGRVLVGDMMTCNQASGRVRGIEMIAHGRGAMPRPRDPTRVGLLVDVPVTQKDALVGHPILGQRGGAA
ncbi:MAG: hypothetical protein AAFY65_12590 [Pseudomonadota bacterium]